MTHVLSLLGLLLCIALCFAVVWAGSLFTMPSIRSGWYDTLPLPKWGPPKWLFGPVWTLLYLMMALVAWQVWRTDGFSDGWLPLLLFAVQLVLNVAWSWLFFGRHLPGAAFAEIVVLWAAIAATLLASYQVSPLAGYLLLPYLLWVSFASVLNFAIWRGKKLEEE